MKWLFILLVSLGSVLAACEFTVSSYNCGGLSDHYDYFRAVTMQKVMEERFQKEPLEMALVERIQALALKRLFSDGAEKEAADEEWQRKGYDELSERLTKAPTVLESPNRSWYEKTEGMLSSYNMRPVQFFDKEVQKRIEEHSKDLAGDAKGITKARAIMAKRAFHRHLQYDIICIQEGDYLDKTMFPKTYDLALSDSRHSKNGVAWNQEVFELVEVIGDIVGRGFAVKLLHKESGKTVAIASGHITGCNPYRHEIHPVSGKIDSLKGDNELQTIIEVIEAHDPDLILLGIDSNVTSLHPRLGILKGAGFKIDYENFLEPTCSSPYQVLNTRIDWIAIKAKDRARIINIPVLSIGLDSLETNMSDHKPIAAKVVC